MDLHDIGSELEQIEAETAELSDQKAALESKEQELSEAVSKLREDVEISDIVGAKEAQNEKELENTEQKLQSYRSQVEALEDSLQALREELQNSEAVISQLEALGENVSEGLSVLEARRQLLEECERQLQEIVERLEMDSALQPGETGDQSAAAGAQEAQQETGDDRQENPQQQRSAWADAPVAGATGFAALSTPDLLAAASRTQQMRADMERGLAGNPERAAEWDIGRGRLSAESAAEADALRQRADAAAEASDAALKRYYQAVEAAGDDPQKLAAALPLRAEYSALHDEVRRLRSAENNARQEADYLARGLNPEDRTTMVSVGGGSLTALHGMLTPQQGNAVPDFRGTCGICSSADTATMLGVRYTEAEAIAIARAEKACRDKPILPVYPERVKEAIRNHNGGTNCYDREKILHKMGFEAQTERVNSLTHIADQINSGRGAILGVDARVLHKDSSLKSTRAFEANHGVSVTGVEFNAKGEPVGLWLHDTGVHSSMGTEFFCSAADFEMIKKTPGSSVLFVWKKAK